MLKNSSDPLQMKEISTKGIGLDIPRMKQVSSKAKVDFFLSKLYEANLIGTEDYVMAKKIMGEKRRT